MSKCIHCGEYGGHHAADCPARPPVVKLPSRLQATGVTLLGMPIFVDPDASDDAPVLIVPPPAAEQGGGQ